MIRWTQWMAAVIAAGVVAWGCFGSDKKSSNPAGPSTNTGTGDSSKISMPISENGTYQVSGNVLTMVHSDTSRECNGSTLVTTVETDTETIIFTLSGNSATFMIPDTREIKDDSGVVVDTCYDTTVVSATRSGSGTSITGTWTMNSVTFKPGVCQRSAEDSLELMFQTSSTISGTVTIGSTGTYSMSGQQTSTVCLMPMVMGMVSEMTAADTNFTVTSTGCSKITVNHPNAALPLTVTINSNGSTTMAFGPTSCTTNMMMGHDPTTCPEPESCMDTVTTAFFMDVMN